MYKNRLRMIGGVKHWMMLFCVIAALQNSQAFAQQTQAAGGETGAPASTATTESSVTIEPDFLNDILSTPEQPAQELNADTTTSADSGVNGAEPAPDAKANEPLVEANGSTASDAKALDLIPVKMPVSEPESAAASQAHSNRSIEEIVVTATKREENLREIPASISAFSGESLENEGKLSLNDFISQSPGVTVAQGNNGFSRITMRGISSDTNPTSPTPSPVGIFIGDISFTDPYIANIIPDLSAFDLAGVEVLKGPQGTLFGGAALSGAIRYQLQEPVLGEWQFRGFTQYNHPDQGGQALTTGAAVNIPLLKDNNLAMRLVYVDRHYPGVYDDTRSGEKNVNHGSGNQIRGILMWEPTDAWKLKLTHLYQKSNTPNGLSTSDSPDGPRQSNDNIIKEPSYNHFSMDNAEINYNFDSMRVVSQSAYVIKDAVFEGNNTSALIGDPPAGYPASLAAYNKVIDQSKAFSQEIRLQSTGDDPFKWLVGAYYFKYSGYFDLLIDTTTTHDLLGPGSLINTVAGALGVPGAYINANTPLLKGVSQSHSDERALFTDLRYTLWDSLDLSIGARIYSTEVQGGYIGSGVLLLAENNFMDSNTVGSLKEHGINPKFSATYHFSEEISLYAMGARGFRFGGVQGAPSTATNGVPPVFKSDSLWNYELGLRTSWLDDTLHADITGFYLFYKNPIILQATTDGLIPLRYRDNVSSAISRGLELSFLWNPPVDGLSVSLNGGLTDAHITTPFQNSKNDVVPAGQEMPGAARVQYATSVQYLRPISFLLVGANAGYTYVGKGYSNLTHDVEINGFGTLNAGFTLAAPLSFRPKLAINLNNILNTTKPVAGGIGTAVITRTQNEQYALNPPRTITVRLSLDF